MTVNSYWHAKKKYNMCGTKKKEPEVLGPNQLGSFCDKEHKAFEMVQACRYMNLMLVLFPPSASKLAPSSARLSPTNHPPNSLIVQRLAKQESEQKYPRESVTALGPLMIQLNIHTI